MVEDTAKEVMVIQAELIAQGYCEQTNDGIRITRAGFSAAHKIVMELPPTDRIMIGLFWKWVGAHGLVPPEE